jgi:surface carbohydrate biosynthesis protein
MKPTIYICIEIKNREYESQILLAASAALRGYRVYLGTHAAIYTLIRSKNVRDGILFDKSMQPRTRILWNRERVEYYCVLDAELSPVLIENVARKALPSRIYPNTEELVDRFLVVGPVMDKVAREYFGARANSIRMTGWPRIDIWTKHGSVIYKADIEKIKERYGKYLLFASSFGNIRNPEYTKDLKNADQVQETEMNAFESMMKQHLNFKKTIKILKEWDANRNIPPIVVRAHTSESVTVWKKELGRLRKTFIDNSGDITPWLLASEGLIHNGSTAAVQAVFADKPIFLIQETTNIFVLPMALSVSKYLLDGESDFSINDFSKVKVNSEYKPSLLESVIFNPQSNSTSRVIDIFDELDTKKSNPHSRVRVILSHLNQKSCRRALGLLRDEVTWKFGRTNMNSQLHFIPGGLDDKKIKMVLKIDAEFDRVQHKRMTINLWEFQTPPEIPAPI